jgi:hypothetical protein
MKIIRTVATAFSTLMAHEAGNRDIEVIRPAEEILPGGHV